jgi:hypothetical protein
MNISESQLANLRAFGYTESESRFLYIAATHSGYFTVRRFLEFAKAKSGKRSACFVAKLIALGHASAQRYTRKSLVYHIHSRRLFAAIGKDYLRHRREHELHHIKTQLLALNFILAHPENEYLETAQSKRQYFTETLTLDSELFTSEDASLKPITFSDGFPVFLACPPPELLPVVTFTYLDSGHWNLDPYVAHLRRYRPLFQHLPSFQFIYISTSTRLQSEARELFSLLIKGEGLPDLLRYFDVRTKWNRKQYWLVTDADLIFRNEAKKRFTGPRFETLYRLWCRNQLPGDIARQQTTLLPASERIRFQAITVPGHETVFGKSAKRWGDDWQVRAFSERFSAQTSPTPKSKLFKQQQIQEGGR